MEPLRGGRLVDLLPKSAKLLFEQDKGRRTAAEIAFRWLYNQPEVTCVLSGMNSIEMITENARTADNAFAGHFSKEDELLVEQVKAEIHKNVKVSCTGCGYCMPCPAGVDIPGCFRAWNTYHTYQNYQLVSWSWEQALGEGKQAKNCIKCGKCEAACPQKLSIRKDLEKVQADLDKAKV